MLNVLLFSIAIALVGSLLHFAYAWSRRNKIVAAFAAVNESVWEHVKIALVPTLIFCVFSPLFFSRIDIDVLTVASMAALISVAVFIPLLHYPIHALLKKHIVIVGIIEFFISIFLSQLLFRIVAGLINFSASSTLCNTQISYNSVLVALSVSVFFATIGAIPFFTFFPPRLGFFRDPRNGKYGLDAYSAHHHHHKKAKEKHD